MTERRRWRWPRPLRDDAPPGLWPRCSTATATASALLCLCCLSAGISSCHASSIAGDTGGRDEAATALAAADDDWLLERRNSVICDQQLVFVTCPSGTIIDVVRVHYGRSVPGSVACPYAHHDGGSAAYSEPSEKLLCAAEGALLAVMQLCQERRSCKLNVTPRAFGGDPCPRVGKYLNITYRCMPSKYSVKTACEGDALQLVCNGSQRLYIDNVSTWRVSADSAADQCDPASEAPEPWRVEPHSVDSGVCADTDAASIRQQCTGKRRCVIDQLRSACSDVEESRPNDLRRFDVRYACVWRALPTSFGRTTGDIRLGVTKYPGGLAETPSVSDLRQTRRGDQYPVDNLLMGWVHSIKYAKDNEEKLTLYGLLCGCLALLLALGAVTARLLIERRLRRRGGRSSSGGKLSGSEPLTGSDRCSGGGGSSSDGNTYVPALDPSDVALLSYHVTPNGGAGARCVGDGCGGGGSSAASYNHSAADHSSLLLFRTDDVRKTFYENDDSNDSDRTRVNSLYDRHS